MARKNGFEPCQGSATYKRSPMGECDTYLEFYMSKDSIGAAEFGFGQPCTAEIPYISTLWLRGNLNFCNFASLPHIFRIFDFPRAE